MLANPITERERDVDALLDRLAVMNIFALEVIPHRNTKDRLREVIDAAKARHCPVFNGTEHNTPAAQPLLDPLSLDPEFLPWFDGSAAVLLGHQASVAKGERGFVRYDGVPTMSDPQERLGYFGCVGWELWQKTAARA